MYGTIHPEANMVDAFLSGGVMMWPLLLIGVGILVIAVRTARLLAHPEVHPAEADRRLQTILFWGGMSVVLGTLGTVVGIVQMAQYFVRAGSVHPPLVWSGLGVALVTLIFGLLILLVSLLLWFGLRQWHAAASARNRFGLPAA